MDGHPFLSAALPQQRAISNIIVDLVNVGIGVMDDVVFDLPNKGVTPSAFMVNPIILLTHFFSEKLLWQASCMTLNAIHTSVNPKKNGARIPEQPYNGQQQE